MRALHITYLPRKATIVFIEAFVRRRGKRGVGSGLAVLLLTAMSDFFVKNGSPERYSLMWLRRQIRVWPGTQVVYMTAPALSRSASSPM